MGTKVTVHLDTARINAMLVRHTSASARRAAETTQRRAKANWTKSGRVKTGKARNSIKVRKVSQTNTTCTYTVGSDLDYFEYQEKGIGPVFAGPGRVLRFKPKGAQAFIFRPRTSGFEGGHFMRDAYRRLTLADFLPK